jgi:glutathione S-transferase
MPLVLWRPAYEGSPPTWRVQLVLAEKGLTWEEKRVSFSEKPDALLAANPRGQVPTLEDGSVSAYETNAILEYLDHTYPRPSLLPEAPAERAVALVRINEVSGYLMAAFMAFWKYRGSRKPEEIEAETVAEFVSGVKAEWHRWERYLESSGTGWFAGDAISLADLSVFPYLAACVRNGLPVAADYPALAAFHARMRERESVARTWPSSWGDGPGEPLFA